VQMARLPAKVWDALRHQGRPNAEAG
jgi:hypothetical protein